MMLKTSTPNRALSYIASVIALHEQGDIRHIISIEFRDRVAEVKYLDAGGNYHHIKCTGYGFRHAE